MRISFFFSFLFLLYFPFQFFLEDCARSDKFFIKYLIKKNTFFIEKMHIIHTCLEWAIWVPQKKEKKKGQYEWVLELSYSLDVIEYGPTKFILRNIFFFFWRNVFNFILIIRSIMIKSSKLSDRIFLHNY